MHFLLTWASNSQRELQKSLLAKSKFQKADSGVFGEHLQTEVGRGFWSTSERGWEEGSSIPKTGAQPSIRDVGPALLPPPCPVAAQLSSAGAESPLSNGNAIIYYR